VAPPRTIQGTGLPGWTLMTAIHDALRRDLEQLIASTASRAAAQARWSVFRDHLHHHLATEDAVMWRPARARLAGDPAGLPLLDAMQDEHQLIGPLQAVTDDAFTMDADPERLRQLLTRLRTRLTSHLAHEETDALPLISQIMTEPELARIAKSIRGGHSVSRAAAMVPWALAGASPDVCHQVLRELPAPARLLHRTAWRPRHTRNSWDSR
jgi:iron-sulfur cluster repair protein YtfE (RIC family)